MPPVVDKETKEAKDATKEQTGEHAIDSRQRSDRKNLVALGATPNSSNADLDANFWRIPHQMSGNEENTTDNETLLDQFNELPAATQQLLKSASCLGCLDTSLLKASTELNKESILQLLNDVEFSVNGDTLTFIYQEIPINEASRLHVTIGRNLIQNLPQDELSCHYYTVLRQYKLGNDSITNQCERNSTAKHCLEAAEHAVSQSDFLAASQFLDFGISLLEHDNCWKDDYDLTLALYNDATEVEYSRSNFERVDALVATVLKHARCFRDSIRARASRIYSLSTRYQMTEAVEESLQVLNHLGERFPSNPTRFHIARELVRVWRLLRGKTNEMILRMPLMRDPDKVATMQVLNLLFPGAYRTRPKLWGVIVLRLVRLTLLYGLSPVSAVGFGFYSAILSMITKDINGGYRYAKLALALLDKFHAKEWIPRVYMGVFGHAYSYRRSLRSAYPKLQEAHETGLETGDIEFSCLSAAIKCLYQIFTGDSLVVTEKEAIAYSEIFKANNQEAAVRMITPCIQFLQNLLGKNDHPQKLVGDVNKDANIITELLTQAAKFNDEISVGFIYYYQMVLAYVFNDYETATEKATKMQRITRPPYLHPSISSPFTFYTLSLLAVCENRKGRARRRILSIAKRCVKKLTQFSHFVPENCLAKTFLVQAELAVVMRKDREAKCHYESSISVSARYTDYMVRAIACERAGRFSSSCGDAVAATHYFREAHMAYKEWGALAKARQLGLEMPELL